MSTSHRGLFASFTSTLAFVAIGCAAELPPPSSPIVTEPPTAPAVAAAFESAPAPATEVAQAAPSGSLFCTATADGNTRELYLDWKGDKANGTLRTSNAKGVREEPVRAERTKARVVVEGDAKAATPKATIVVKGDAKKIQLGDGKQPWTSCR